MLEDRMITVQLCHAYLNNTKSMLTERNRSPVKKQSNLISSRARGAIFYGAFSFAPNSCNILYNYRVYHRGGVLMD